jgi:hypothetical protein
MCRGQPTYKCDCSAGWRGSDCSERVCSSGRSWFSLPSADDTGHALAECSDMGVCDRSKGACTCTSGFEGGACQYRICPGTPACSGHGQCMTVAALAQYRTNNGEPWPTQYGSVPNNPATWDEDSTRACLCDHGFLGHDCSQRGCPSGDDPMVPRGTNTRIQLICAGTTGHFALKFRGQMTANIPFDSPAAVVQAELEKMTVVGRVKVDLLQKDTAGSYASRAVINRACTPNGINELVVTFLDEYGPLPPVTAHKDIGRTQTNTVIVVNENGAGLSVLGTKKNLECNGRGLCNRETGDCACFTGYGSSDGNGNAGSRGDCGHVEKFAGEIAKGGNLFVLEEDGKVGLSATRTQIS